MSPDRGLFQPPRNFAGITPPEGDFDHARVVILPAPYDGTTEWRSGAREGPRAIIDASQYLEFYDLDLDREIWRVGIHTLPELVPDVSRPQAMIGRVTRAVRGIVSRDKLPVMLGGEHTLTLGAVQALKEKYPDLTVLQLDAHTDLRDRYLGSRYADACVMRRISDLCPIVQVGCRAMSLEEREFLRTGPRQPFFMASIRRDPEYADRAVAMLGKHVYVSIDLDVFDPSLMPAVGTPEPGGMLWHEVLALLRSVARDRRVVGFDIMELSPREGPAACAYTAASLAYKMIGYCVPGG